MTLVNVATLHDKYLQVAAKKKTTRNISIDQYRKKLLAKIGGANSPENVRRYVDAAIKAMHTHKVNGHLVARFIQKSV